jgi:hypothetical protein
VTVAITFAQAKEIVRAAGEKYWTLGTFMIEDDGWEDATYYLLVRGTAEPMGDNPDLNFILVPGLLPLVNKLEFRSSRAYVKARLVRWQLIRCPGRTGAETQVDRHSAVCRTNFFKISTSN